MRRIASSRAGQAMVESVVVILALSLVFFCAVQFCDLLRTRLLLSHAAARVARARTAGLNRYMAEKSARVALIPVSGKRLTPSSADIGLNAASATYAGRAAGSVSAALRAPAFSPEAEAELWRIPAYLASEDESYARGILDYELWDRTRIDCGGAGEAGRITASVSQSRPRLPGLARILGISGDGDLFLEGRSQIENHAGYYLESWTE